MMKMKIHPYLLLFILPLFSFSAHSVKAKPGLLELQQNDGSVITIKLYGDERFHFATDSSDRLIIPNDEGIYEYAVKTEKGETTFSGVRVAGTVPSNDLKFISAQEYIEEEAGNPKNIRGKNHSSGMQASRGTGEAKYRYSASAFPTIGEPHSVVVLVEYSDVGFSMDNPKEYYNDFLNGEKFTHNGATGSCRQYYMENSSGAFVPTFDVYGPVKLKNKRMYYGAGDERYAYQMVVESVHALDAEVDFSQYDHNADGYVDSIYIIYAGQGEADSGLQESVWPFSWELEAQNVSLYADGVKFNTYGCSNEIKYNKKVDGIGTFTHEFGHVLGLPDLYNTDSTSDMTTPCSWSLMDSGSYSNGSRTPPNLSSFERYSLGWISPEEISRSGTHKLLPLGESNQAYIATTKENKDEFYLFEYRLQEGWDAYLPSQGMIAWHIDFVQEVWDMNVVNNMKGHKYVKLIRADGSSSYDLGKEDRVPFPGSQGITEFSTKTNPAFLSWKGNELNILSLHDITENPGVEITFKTDVGASVDSIEESEGPAPVFDMMGRSLGMHTGESIKLLGKGIYIYKGKKVLIK